jgi:hypothetical protein
LGHERVGVLPKTRPWRKVVTQIADSAGSDQEVGDIAEATLRNVRDRLQRIQEDQGVKEAFKFLLSLINTAASSGSPLSTKVPRIDLASDPSILQLAAGLHQWVDDHRQSQEYAEIAKRAAADTMAVWTEKQAIQPALIGGPVTAEEVWRRAANPAGFCEVARLFFAKFTERYLKYFLDREASAALAKVHRRDEFSSQLAGHVDVVSQHAFETAKIAQSFAAGWYHQHARGKIPSDPQINRFLDLAFSKIREELLREGSR